MKTLLLLLAITCSLLAAEPPREIQELRLKDGRVLRGVTVISYGSSAIVAKWQGGRGTIAYDDLPAEMAKTAAGMRPKPEGRPEIPAESQEQVGVTGQMFVNDLEKHNNDMIKVAGAEIYAYPLSYLPVVMRSLSRSIPAYTRRTVDLSSEAEYAAVQKAIQGVPVIRKTQTDADGRFSMKLPKNIPVFLFSQPTIRYQGWPMRDYWFVPVDGGEVLLTLSNKWHYYNLKD